MLSHAPDTNNTSRWTSTSRNGLMTHRQAMDQNQYENPICTALDLSRVMSTTYSEAHCRVAWVQPQVVPAVEQLKVFHTPIC